MLQCLNSSIFPLSMQPSRRKASDSFTVCKNKELLEGCSLFVFWLFFSMNSFCQRSETSQTNTSEWLDVRSEIDVPHSFRSISASRKLGITLNILIGPCSH